MSDLPPENTGPKHGGAPPFKPGQSGNPAGRPKGSRNKLGEAFITALYQDFDEHGADAIRAARAEDPVAYVKVLATILPKEVKISDERELSDAELERRIRQTAAELGISFADATGEPPGGGEAA